MWQQFGEPHDAPQKGRGSGRSLKEDVNKATSTMKYIAINEACFCSTVKALWAALIT